MTDKMQEYIWVQDDERDVPRRLPVYDMPECRHHIPLDTGCIDCAKDILFEDDAILDMPNNYLRPVPYEALDIYRILDMYDVHSHAIGHAVKKLLMAGRRGYKGRVQDYEEAIKSIQRQIDMIKEDEALD